MPLEVTRTALPSTVIFCDLEREQFFAADTRTGDLLGSHWISVVRELCNDVCALDEKLQQDDRRFGFRHTLKIRNIWIDDKNGCFTVRVDYLHDKDVEPLLDESAIQTFLKSDIVVYHGQPHNVEVSIKTANFSSDYFSAVGDDYYK